MDRSKVQRSDLKNNFLKEIIMRLDFQGVLQAEMEEILLEVKPYLKNKSFIRYEENISNQVIKKGDSISDLKSQVVYSFFSEAYTVRISSTSIILDVKSRSYFPFSDYADIFEEIVDIYKRKIDFFTAKRFGLRKINFCYIKNRDDITRYFAPQYYFCDLQLPGFHSLSTRRTEHLSDENRNINLTHAIEEGEIKGSIYQKVTLDTDIYVTDQNHIEKILTDESALNDINEKIFEIYINTLSDSFLDLLAMDGELSTDEIVGVEPNE